MRVWLCDFCRAEASDEAAMVAAGWVCLAELTMHEVPPSPFGISHSEPRDLRIEFSGEAPTHGELLAMLAGVFQAEDRYNGFGQLGRGMFFGLIRQVNNYVSTLDSPELTRLIAEAEKGKTTS